MGKHTDVNSATLLVGWGQEDITPPQPVLLDGLFHARISEGVKDALTVTAWAIESGKEQALFVSCDLICISDELREAVLKRLKGSLPELDIKKVVLNATHTHTAPATRKKNAALMQLLEEVGSTVSIVSQIMSAVDYVNFASDKISDAATQAWHSRAPGGIAYGLGEVVIGRNRRWVDDQGEAVMYTKDAQDKQRINASTGELKENVYNLAPSIRDAFRHVEGYENHKIQAIAVYDLQSELTGLVVNVPCPAQESEEEFMVSADWWHEVRAELRQRLGDEIYILPQCSAAGDLSPHFIFDQRAHNRMLELKGRTPREEIACRIADEVENMLSYIGKAIDWNPVFIHAVEKVDLAANVVSDDELHALEREAQYWKAELTKEKEKLASLPNLQESPRWYVDLTYAFNRYHFNQNTLERVKNQQEPHSIPIEFHVMRIGDLVLSTNPFELYLDYGNQIEMCSPFIQTFLVQLAGQGTYVPSPRSVSGGGYGSTSASNLIGPAGGRQLVEATVRTIRSLWENGVKK